MLTVLLHPHRLLYSTTAAFSAARAGTDCIGVTWSAGPVPRAVGTMIT